MVCGEIGNTDSVSYSTYTWSIEFQWTPSHLIDFYIQIYPSFSEEVAPPSLIRPSDGAYLRLTGRPIDTESAYSLNRRHTPPMEQLIDEARRYEVFASACFRSAEKSVTKIEQFMLQELQSHSEMDVATVVSGLNKVVKKVAGYASDAAEAARLASTEKTRDATYMRLYEARDCFRRSQLEGLLAVDSSRIICANISYIEFKKAESFFKETRAFMDVINLCKEMLEDEHVDLEEQLDSYTASSTTLSVRRKRLEDFTNLMKSVEEPLAKATDVHANVRRRFRIVSRKYELLELPACTIDEATLETIYICEEVAKMRSEATSLLSTARKCRFVAKLSNRKRQMERSRKLEKNQIKLDDRKKQWRLEEMRHRDEVTRLKEELRVRFREDRARFRAVFNEDIQLRRLRGNVLTNSPSARVSTSRSRIRTHNSMTGLIRSGAELSQTNSASLECRRQSTTSVSNAPEICQVLAEVFIPLEILEDPLNSDVDRSKGIHSNPATKDTIFAQLYSPSSKPENDDPTPSTMIETPKSVSNGPSCLHDWIRLTKKNLSVFPIISNEASSGRSSKHQSTSNYLSLCSYFQD